MYLRCGFLWDCSSLCVTPAAVIDYLIATAVYIVPRGGRDTNCRRDILSTLNAVTDRPLAPTPITTQSVFVRFYRHSSLDLDSQDVTLYS